MLETIGLAILVALVAVLAVGLASRRPGTAPAVSQTDDSAQRGSGLNERTVLESMPVGVVLLNELLIPVSANPAARTFLGIPDGGLPPRLRSEELESIARGALASGSPVTTDLNLWPRQEVVRAEAVPAGDEQVLVFLRDVTAEMQTQQIRRQFVLNASHELKSPVSGIQALAEAIQDAQRDDDERAHKLTDRLVEEAARLSRLVEDLLDLSRLEDPSNISRTNVDLSSIVRAELDLVTERASEHGTEIAVTIEPTVVVAGDAGQLGLMARNLLDNAVRYTAPGDSIDVTVAREGDEVTFEVADTGIGIPLQAQARVFERFFRVDEARDRDSGGTGLGLSIVRHVADMHGGHVSLRSELGEGSVFTVKLPAANRQVRP